MASNVERAFSGQVIIRTEVIMTMYEMHYFFGRRSVARVVRATAGLLGIAMLGYVAIMLVEHTLPAFDVSSGRALESRMVDPDGAAPMTGGQATRGVATASVPSAPPTGAPAPDVGYFPRHYANQATTIEEQSPTF